MDANEERAAVVLHLQRKASALDAVGIVWLASLYRTAAYEIAQGLHIEALQGESQGNE